MANKIDLTKLQSEYVALRADRAEWEAEWKTISDYLLPGRGIYQLYTKPRKRKLTNPNVINPTGREAQKVLTSGLHGGLTSPSRPWLALEYEDENTNDIHPLVSWMSSNEKRLGAAFASSNFYQTIHSFYTEYSGYGTGAIYVGEDSDKPFRFEVLTAGEYAFAVDSTGRPNKFYRTIFMTPQMMVHKFGEKNVSDTVREAYKKEETRDTQYLTVVQAITPDRYLDKPFRSVYFELGSNANTRGENKPLKVSGFYEFPFMVGRWDIIGADTYGLGPGSEAIPNIKRLQELEKAFLIATHKTINPPLNVPSKLRGKVVTLPGGLNYYSNPNEKVDSLYNMNLNFPGIMEAIARVEESIEKIFFNDVFLTSSRDPNASPLRTGEVNMRSEERLLRLGPVIERLGHEVFIPLVERCFNIMLRKGLFEQLSPDLAQMAGNYKIKLISPLAQSQKIMEAQPIERLLQFVGGAAQFDPEALDKIDIDKTIDEYQDVTGAPINILRSDDDIVDIRTKRAQQQSAEKAKQDQLIATQVSGEQALNQSTIAKNYSDAGSNLKDTLSEGNLQ